MHVLSRDRRHHLVEEGDALGDLTRHHPGLAVGQPDEGQHVLVTEAAGDLGGPREGGPGRRWVAAEECSQTGEHEVKRPLCAVSAALLQHAGAPRHPAHRRRQVASEHETETVPERAAGGPGRVELRPAPHRPRP